MRTYGQYCPIAKAAETLGDRWTLLIAREMSFGVRHFNELERCLPGISRSVLAARLRQMEYAGLIERRRSDSGRTIEYRLTAAGRDLKPVLHTLGEWAARWAFGDPDPAELDPDLLIRWISRHIASEKLPDRRVVAAFEFRVPKRRRYWLVLEPDEASVCLHDPGFGTDVFVTADTEALYRVYLGKLTLREAIRGGLVKLEGGPSMVRAFPGWFAWSHFAPVVRATARQAASAAS
jgi:DNA-binding HxlR family transcriptional regulator